MTGRLTIVQLNLAYDPALDSPAALLDAYHTLTGWSRAVARAGATVETIQRFGLDDERVDAGVRYRFVADGTAGTPPAWAAFERVANAVEAAAPDLVHINGLMFPAMVRALRRRLPPTTAIALQDHAGRLPRRRPWGLQRWAAARWRRAFADADVCTFTARELADRWRPHGFPSDLPVVEICPAGSSITPVARLQARQSSRLHGSPAILWVGRLDANKDPLTVLDGLEMAFDRLAGAHCWMVYNERTLEEAVRRRIASPRLANRVTLVGAVPHAQLAAYFGAADVFISGSHQEGSGYSLIEAMCCGVTPCVTDIPSFRALTGECGARWRAGDPAACAAALLDVAARDPELERRKTRRRYEEALDWDVLGRRTLGLYRGIVHRRRAERRA